MQKNTQLNFIHIQQQSPNKNTSIYSFVTCSLGSYSVAGTLHLSISFIEHKLKISKTKGRFRGKQEFIPECYDYNLSHTWFNKIFRSVKRETIIKIIPVHSEFSGRGREMYNHRQKYTKKDLITNQKKVLVLK